VKLAHHYELTERDVVLTVLTDSMELYGSRIAELRQERGPYTATHAAVDHERYLLGATTDHMVGIALGLPLSRWFSGRFGDYRVLIGALVQIDDTKEDIDDPSLVGRIEGTGWMVGPYIGIRLTDNLFFDARAAWGQSDNDIALDDPIVGARSGSFDTDRWLASASLTGNEYFGPWRVSPQLQVAYGNEQSDAYKTSLGQSVSSTEATIGRLTGTMEVGYRTELENGTMVEPHVAISGIWNFDSDDLTFNGTVYGTDETRAKIEGGILIQTPEGLGLRWAGSYDGLGAGDYDAYSGSLWVNIPLN